MKRSRFALALLALAMGLGTLACDSGLSPSDVPGAHEGDSQMALRVRKAMAAPTPSLRIVQLAAVLEDLSPENLTEVLDLYQRELSMVSPSEMAVLLESWASFDPEGAYEFTLALPKSTRREDALGVAMQAWALNDPQSARARVEADLKRRREVYVSPTTLYENVTVGWSLSGEPGLLEHLAQEDDASRVISLRAFVGSQTRRSGTVALLESMTSFLQSPAEGPDDIKFKRMVLLALVAVSAKRMPEFTAQWLSGVDSEAVAGLDAEKRVAWYWLPQAPEESFAWVQQTFPPAAAEEVMLESFSLWFKQDQEAALAWLESSDGPGLLRDYGSFANAVRQNAPVGLDLVRSADAIETETLRRRAVVDVLTRWYEREPIYAESWMQSSDLPEAVRESIRRDAIKPARPS